MPDPITFQISYQFAARILADLRHLERRGFNTGVYVRAWIAELEDGCRDYERAQREAERATWAHCFCPECGQECDRDA